MSLFEKYEKREISLSNLLKSLENEFSDDTRKKNGITFTPLTLTDYILSQIGDTITPESKICDISVGSGAILIVILRYLIKTLDINPISAIKMIYGYDINPTNVENTKKLIQSYIKRDYLLDINADELQIHQVDSLLNDVGCDYTHIIMNPPYVRIQELGVDYKEELAKNYLTAKEGSYDLYFLFIEKAMSIIKEDGLVVSINPRNYIFNNTSFSLRKFLISNKFISRIDDFGSEMLFDDQTYTAVSYLSKSNSQIEYNELNLDKTIKSTKVIDYLDITDTTKYEFMSNLDSYKFDNPDYVRLKDLYEITIGCQIYSDKNFICDRWDGNYAYPILDGMEYKVELESTKDMIIVEKGELVFYKCIYPYKKDSGKPLPYTEDELSSKFPKLYDYMLKLKSILIKRDGGKFKGEWFEYGRRQGLDVGDIDFIFTTYSKKNNFIRYNTSDILFSGTKSRGFSPKIEMLSEYVDIIESIINSDVFLEYTKPRTSMIAGGYYSFGTRVIEEFKIPKCSDDLIESYQNAKISNNIDIFIQNIYS
jgi:tRNA1(Val) A37 N6-methylase TrmN6